MVARALRKCPTCRRALTETDRASMGLRNGEVLNSLCPGRIGPCDIDHVIHNGRVSPERVMFFEYKDGAPVGDGQRWLLKSLSGDFVERNDGRLLSVRHVILQQHEPDSLGVLRPAVDWLFPPAARRGAA